MNALIAEPVLARSLVSDKLFDELCRKIVSDQQIDREYAERIMDQALAFLGGVVQCPGANLSPSPAVDIGWHTFILHTRDYAAFCERIAGHYIHHVPDDVPDSHRKLIEPSTLQKSTIAAIKRAGYVVDEELWLQDEHKCGPCHEEGNCSASGVDGNENTETRTPPR